MSKHNLKSTIDRRLSGLEAKEHHVQVVTALLRDEKPTRRKPAAILAISFVIITVIGTALAVVLPPTIQWFQRFYGEENTKIFTSGTLMPINQEVVLGDVVYEWTETIYVGDEHQGDDAVFANALYGTVNISPREGSNIVLIPEDYQLDDPIGYNLLLGERAPEGAPSYLETAAKRNARIILAIAVPEGILKDGKLQDLSEIGYMYQTNKDGSLSYHYEITKVADMQEYQILMSIQNWEVTREGDWLRNESQDTWLKEDWMITVRDPHAKKIP
ncbi:MAG TPA: hypothetical protein VJ064_07860 [Limnochordia bacterium]|jgi:hypothetical protein|nr:hypothetical protein [Clostridiales bacterium]HKM18120.1 hypothetical protein [Limnochordia bacterium]